MVLLNDNISYISYFIKTFSSPFFSTCEVCLGFIHGIVCRLSAYETQLRNGPIMMQTRSIQQDTKMFISMPTEVMNSVLDFVSVYIHFD